MFVFAMCMSLCVEIQRMRCLSVSMYVLLYVSHIKTYVVVC